MFSELLPHLRSPFEGLSLSRARGDDVNADLVGRGGRDRSTIRGGVWQALGPFDPPRSVAAWFNRLPPSPQLYEAVWRTGASGRFAGRHLPLDEELTDMFRRLGDVHGAFGIDIGCSEGLYSRRLAARGARVLAVDYSRLYLRRAVKRAAQEQVRIAATQALAQHLPVFDARADFAVIGGTVNEIGDLDDALREAARVLRPGATLFSMSLLQAEGRPGRAAQRGFAPLGFRFPTEQETFNSYEAAGFAVSDVRRDQVLLRLTARRI